MRSALGRAPGRHSTPVTGAPRVLSAAGNITDAPASPCQDTCPNWFRRSTAEIADLKVHPAMRLRIDNALRGPRHSYFE